MSITYSSDAATAIANAHKMADAGFPIFLARLTEDGDPRLPREWQNSPAGDKSHSAIDRWKPGMALCAVTGIVADVIDIDPRNGGMFSLKKFNDEFGDNGPEVYWRVKTPSGGWHLYIAPMGMAKMPGFMPGIDLQAGAPDGTGRGFVFIPPTVRTDKSVAERVMRPYVGLGVFGPPAAGDPTVGPLRAWLTALREERAAGSGDHAAIAEDAASASPGEQHTALASYAWDLAKMGLTEAEGMALLQLAAKGLELNGRPWSAGDLAGLFRSAAKKVIGNARGDELDGLGDGERVRRLLTRPIADVEETILRWLWLGYLGFGILTQWDGEKGQGKSFVIADIVARATRGKGMPNAEEVLSEPIDVLIFAEDDSAMTRKRLRAAGADLSRIHEPDPEWAAMVKRAKDKSERRGAVSRDDVATLLLPYGIDNIKRMIKDSGAGLVIFDPITDYLGEDISTNNDASVRRALDPLGRALASLGVAGLSIRHMNKDTKQEAKYRGGGSTAFQNRARVHIISGSLQDNAETEGDFGLMMVDNNYMPKVPGALSYSIEDSTVRMDSSGNMVGRVAWAGLVELSANELASGGKARGRGPEATTGDAIKAIISDMFTGTDSWAAADAIDHIHDALAADGLPAANIETIHKARRAMGVKTVQKAGGWVWIPEGKIRVRNG